MRMMRIERSAEGRQRATRGRMRAGLGLLVLGGLMLLLWPAFDWAVTSAFWLGEGPQACPDKSGACWPFIRERFGQIMYGAYPEAERWRVNLGLGLGALLLVPLILLPLRRKAAWIGGFLLLYPMAALALFAGGVFGLEPVGTSAWGGLFLTIVVGLFAFTAAFPMGILLALGRQSPIPVVRLLAGIWVEFWRGVPTLVVLFVAVIMLPLFLPVEREIDKLARALIALSILMSCYVGESIRGALRSVPRGQYEAARALGMGYWRAHVHVILPQAIRVATPQITNIVIGLFKETSLLVVIGLSDLLGVVQSASGDTDWHLSSARATGYLFIALLYWGICFAMSRYSAHLERRSRLGWAGGATPGAGHGA